METMPFRACVCEIRTVYLFMTQMSERDPWHRYNDQWQSTFDTVSKWICECLSTDECVCIGLVCVLLCSQGAGEKGDAGGERNDQDGLFFSQACQTCSSAACQCQHKAERLEYISSLASYRSAMTGLFFNYQASLLSLPLSHTNTLTCAHACVPAVCQDGCGLTACILCVHMCIWVFPVDLWTQ